MPGNRITTLIEQQKCTQASRVYKKNTPFREKKKRAQKLNAAELGSTKKRGRRVLAITLSCTMTYIKSYYSSCQIQSSTTQRIIVKCSITCSLVLSHFALVRTKARESRSESLRHTSCRTTSARMIGRAMRARHTSVKRQVVVMGANNSL